MSLVSNSNKPMVVRDARLDIQDTEFLLRHLIEGQYSGREIEQVGKTLEKIKRIHQKLLEIGVEV